MSRKKRMGEENSLRGEARRAKERMKSGFWQDCKEDMQGQMEKAREQGFNESKAERYFASKISAQIAGEKEDEFYLKVKEMLTEEGEQCYRLLPDTLDCVLDKFCGNKA